VSVRREPDLVALVDVLNRHRVDYVLVGGMAALMYRASRPTEDLDILARDMDDNMDRLAAALNDLHASSDIAEHASTDELRAMNTRWVTSAGVVDVLVSAQGPNGTTINWRTIDPAAQTIDVDGHRLRIAALEDLLVMKLSVGRERDIEVAEQLAPGSSRAFAERFGDRAHPATPPPPATRYRQSHDR
jgi:Nucleotidyl transferase AbiEii toxin, Type IV TA system